MGILTRIIQCPSRGCDRYYEVEYTDILMKNATALRFEVRCPACGSVSRINRKFYEELVPQEKAKEPTTPPSPLPTPAAVPVPEPKKSAGPRADTATEKMEKAIKAAKAMQKSGGNKAKAAEELGVSVPTIVNWMRHLPPAVEPAEL